MGLRSFLEGTEPTVLTEPVDPRFELPALATRDETRPVVFDDVVGHPDVRAVANLVSTRSLIGSALGVEPSEIIDEVSSAMDDPSPVSRTEPAAFEHVADDPTIAEELPVPIYYDEHERQYFASTIVIAKDPDTGVHNLSFHRMMVQEDNRLVMRMVERHLHDIYTRSGEELDIAIVVGVHPAVEIAAATSFSPDMSELELANRLHGGELATTEIHGLQIPSEAEVVMFATITDELADEGPFVDLSRTWDKVRQQPVVEVNELWTRPDPLARVIVPGKREHAHLMGIPQEPRIYRIVENTVPTVRNVVLTPGGCSWLHGVVQLEPRADGDPKNAGMAALSAHPSMKKVTLVDPDVDPADPDAVEWATATRMQPHEDIVTIEGAKGSSLDPSQNYERGVTSKWIVDATMPRDRDREAFLEATVPGAEDVSLEEYQ
ncbi:UbiD family decarboxylase [Halalkaliarchaeum desulfuricum]|uniref:Anhydromevalonate phosphate decarboxylase n=1 Tax=Halalkaliarchaeum desulfuricum TaxID=2055893 RepID=A0A343TJX6_9EURY|nr:UbiD family decarboxylase [Halalkaliarchaeum desulfuricum]AUX09398.1 UbiD family decarboxylase [Halalkaliarchaeum desulfuricum]